MTTTSASVPGARLDLVESLVGRMSREYDVEPDLVRNHALLVLEDFADSRVQSFIPVLVERHVREWLRQSRRLAALVAEQPAAD